MPIQIRHSPAVRIEAGKHCVPRRLGIGDASRRQLRGRKTNVFIDKAGSGGPLKALGLGQHEQLGCEGSAWGPTNWA